MITEQNITKHKKIKNEFKFFSFYLAVAFSLFLFFMFNQTPIPLPLNFFTTLLFIFPVGYAILLPLKKVHEISIFVRIILYLSVGYLFNFTWSFFLSPFTTHPIIPFSLLSISVLIIFLNFYKFESDNNVTKKQKFFKKLNWFSLLKESDIKFNIKKSDISLFLLLTVFLIIIMSMFNTYGWWPPYGDYEGHSRLIAMQQVDNKLTFHYPFLSNIEMAFPLGVHFFSASLSNLYNITPAETVLMINGISMFLFIGVLMSIVYILTKSFWLVLIVFIFIFNINQGDLDGSGSIWGYFVVGILPELAGLLSLFVLILVLLIKEDGRSFPIFLLLMIIGSMVVFPLGFTYSILVVGIFLISKIPIKDIRKKILKKVSCVFTKLNKRNLVNLNYIFLIIIVIGSLEGIIFEHVKSVLNNVSLHKSWVTAIFSDVSTYSKEEVFFPSIIIGILSSIYIIIYLKEQRFVGIFTLSFILVQISDWGPLEIVFSNHFFFHLIPIFSWIVLSIVIYSTLKNNRIKFQNKILNFINQKKDETISNSGIFNSLLIRIKTKSFRNYIVLLSFGILTLTFVIPDIPMIVENGAPTGYKHYVDALPYLAGMKWVEKNVESDDIVLSFVNPNYFSIQNFPHDRYFIWLEGMKYHLVVNGGLDSLFIEKENKVEINEAFSNFRFSGTLGQVLKENEIKYIITTYDEKRNVILEEYDFLDVVFRDDFTVVYKVQIKSIRTEEMIKKDLATTEFAGDYKVAISIYDKFSTFDPAALKEAWKDNIRIVNKLNENENAKLLFSQKFDIFPERKIAGMGEGFTGFPIGAYIAVWRPAELLGINEGFTGSPLSGVFSQSLKESEVKYIITTVKEQNHEILQNYDFLDVVFNDGLIVVYKLNINLLPSLEEGTMIDFNTLKKLELGGDFEKALTGYKKIRELLPNSYAVWMAEIRVLSKLDKYDEAKSLFDNVINQIDQRRNLPANDIETIKSLTKLYHKSLEDQAKLAMEFFEYKDALKAYDTILFDKRIDLEILIKKAKVLEKLEKFSKARDIYLSVLSGHPDNDIVKKRLEELEKKLAQNLSMN